MTELPSQYKFGKSYMLFPLREEMFAGFPGTIEYKGEVLHKKSSFHVSLMCFKGVSDMISEYELVSFFSEFVKEAPISFDSFGDEFRFAKKDKRKTIILPCVMNNTDRFFTALNKKFNTNVPTLPTHVTLYTLQKEVGIGINSSEEMMSAEVVHIPELLKSLEELKS